MKRRNHGPLLGTLIWLTNCTPSNDPTHDTPYDITRRHVEVQKNDALRSHAVHEATLASLHSGSCPHPLPAGWPASFSSYPYNPMLVATAAAASQGADNVYAPELHSDGGIRLMWYGAQGRDGHDQIFFAWSQDGMSFNKWPSDDAPAPALARGSSNHVNDPSVVRQGDTWRMYYTDAPIGEQDEIWLAESKRLSSFTKVQRVLSKGPIGSWDEDKVGRPAVLLEGGVYYLWYDGLSKGRRHVGLATSTDGIHFTRSPQNPLFLDAGAVDVKRVQDTLVMLREAGDGTYFATSLDGLCWIDRGKLLDRSGSAYDRFGQVTPFLEVAGDRVQAIWFGGASVATWNKNRIAAAFPSGSTPSGGGCTQCVTAGQSCTGACSKGRLGAIGRCAVPGSTSPGACCACLPSGCEACVPFGDCRAACVAAGKSVGFCANPGSTLPGRCCACLE